MATGKCIKKFEVHLCGFWDMQADRQTDKFITILHIPPGDEVKTRIAMISKIHFFLLLSHI